MALHSRQNVLGVGVNPINLRHAVAAVAEWTTKRTPAYVCLAAAHSIMDCYRDERTKLAFNNSQLVAPDGMSLCGIYDFAATEGFIEFTDPN